MKSTKVSLPDELDARLRLEAKPRGMTISELIREAINAYLGGAARHSLLSAGAGRSGHADVSDRVEALLNEASGR
jgi:predicted transcriptional regulator